MQEQVREKEVKLEDRYIRWFSDISKNDVKDVGGKAANLGEMANMDLPVPPGFVINSRAYSYFLENTGLKDKIYEKLKGLDVEDTELLNKIAKEIRETIINEELPDDLREEILEAYEVLGMDEVPAQISQDALSILKMSEPAFVAVRSSATAEDSSEASFAGQQETFLNVKGKEEVIDKVKRCFASLFTARSIYYRVQKGFEHEKVLNAVVVQRMVNADKSGVIFSRDPVTKKDDVVIEAVFGLGEGIVSGKINPDQYIVDRELEIIKKNIADKKIAIVRTSSGKSEEAKLSESRSTQQVLNQYEIKRLASHAIKLEEHYEKPQDIEFALDSGEIYIVQTRPITTLEKEVKETKVEGKVLLEGLAASPGVGSGEVHVVRDLKDLDKVKKGNILVTKMTNPDMVVTMQKSSGIVTDEGGATCFAEDTTILTNQGFMTIKQATEIVNSGGELILLAYNTKDMKPVWKRIISAGKRKSKTIRVSVSQTGKIEDNYLDLTSEHKMVLFEDRELIKKQISEILKDNEMLCLIDKLPLINRLHNPKKAYLLGVLLTDGYFKIIMHYTGNPRRGIVVFTQKDTEGKKEFINTVRNYFQEIFREEFKEPRIKYNKSKLRGRTIEGCASDHICSKLAPALEITKISQNLDRWAMNLDSISSLSFLAGLIDGDGCFLNNRIHIYISKENILQGAILACLNLGIFPQVTKNRNIFHVQILEEMENILKYCKRVRGEIHDKVMGNKLFSARQILGDVVDTVNWKGKIKPYVDNNLLIDSKKVLERVLPLCDKETKKKLERILNSKLRMQRVKKISDIGKIDVYNLEIEADNELDHNFIVFTKKYTPLLVSNSHAAIISREMGIPAVVGTSKATETLKDGMIVTVDGFSGKVYEGKASDLEVGEIEKVVIEPVVKTETKIKVIVDLPSFAERASKTNIKEVGLTRLEGIIAESGKHPYGFLKAGEVDKYEKLIFDGINKIGEYFDEIWIRTSDIRSDEFMNLEGAPKEKEGNPMLGMHGIRDSLKHLEILKAELKAISDVKKKTGILLPQVIKVEEVREVKKIIQDLNLDVILGVMIETPASVEIIDELCDEGIEFISFGTNDLTQYTLAIDRNNEDVQELFDEMDPAILHQLEHVIRVCKKKNVETSICGQAGSKKEMVEFLVKLGIDSISVNADKAKEISEYVKKLEDGGLRGSKLEEKEISNDTNQTTSPNVDEGNIDDSNGKEKEEKNRDYKGRVLYDVVCSRCGKEASVPFKPKEGQDVFCKKCHKKILKHKKNKGKVEILPLQKVPKDTNVKEKQEEKVEVVEEETKEQEKSVPENEEWKDNVEYGFDIFSSQTAPKPQVELKEEKKIEFVNKVDDEPLEKVPKTTDIKPTKEADEKENEELLRENEDEQEEMMREGIVSGEGGGGEGILDIF